MIQMTMGILWLFEFSTGIPITFFSTHTLDSHTNFFVLKKVAFFISNHVQNVLENHYFI